MNNTTPLTGLKAAAKATSTTLRDQDREAPVGLPVTDAEARATEREIAALCEQEQAGFCPGCGRHAGHAAGCQASEETTQ